MPTPNGWQPGCVPSTARVLRVVGSDGVALDLAVPGVAVRGLAALVDLLLAAAAVALVALLGVPVVAVAGTASPSGTGWVDAACRAALRVAVPAVVAAVVVPLVGELALGGRSPGKRALGLAVVDEAGGQAGAAALVTRNLLRPLDILPATYAVGAVALLLSARGQRLGDLAAGTVVVRRPGRVVARAGAAPPRPIWQSMGPPTSAGLASATARVDARAWRVERMTGDHREVLHAFAARRFSMPPAVRVSLSGWLAEVLRRVVDGVQPGVPDELFLEALLLRLTAPPRPRPAPR